jgi:branched-chain amino acid transport system ATP-binding protein
MLILDDLYTYYGQSQVLRGLSLRVPDHTVVALLGRNGMGKTTTIHSIIGFVPPQSGSISLRGEEISRLKSSQIAQKGVALVPQGRRIFPSLTVRENLTVAARGADRPGAWQLEKVYDWFPRLKEREQYKGTLLSGGEQQMLTMGRALMTNPDLLLMDEPSEGLAPLFVQEIGRIIRQLKDEGLSILLVEQNLSLALSVADRVYVISKGSVVYECSPDELRHNEAIKDQYLGAAA